MEQIKNNSKKEIEKDDNIENLKKKIEDLDIESGELEVAENEKSKNEKSRKDKEDTGKGDKGKSKKKEASKKKAKKEKLKKKKTKKEKAKDKKELKKKKNEDEIKEPTPLKKEIPVEIENSELLEDSSLDSKFELKENIPNGGTSKQRKLDDMEKDTQKNEALKSEEGSTLPEEKQPEIKETLKKFEDTIVVTKTKLATPLKIQDLLEDLPENLEREEIADLPISHIKGLSPGLAKQLETTLDIKKISDFYNKFVPREKLALLNLLQITEDEIEKWQAVGNYILRVVKGEAEFTEKKKILLAGLDNAGKTAIINVLTKRFNIASLKPTKNVDVTPLTTDTVAFNIWDMGGQDQYRKIYLSHPERFFIDLYTVIYVVDVQDSQRYKLSLNYLEKILDILQSFSESPDVLVFLHKADPDIYEKLQPELNMLENKFEALCRKYNVEHRILHTSIYNAVLTESNVLDSLSTLFEYSQKNNISPELMNSVQAIYDNFISLSYVLEEKFQYFENRIGNLEAQNRHLFNELSSGRPISATFNASPKNFGAKPMKKERLSPAAARQALNAELKKLFRKRY